jgi:hypothetical protein
MWVESGGPGQGSAFYWTIYCRVPRSGLTHRRRPRSSLLQPRPRGDSLPSLPPHLLHTSPHLTPSPGSYIDSPHALSTLLEEDALSAISSDAGTVYSSFTALTDGTLESVIPMGSIAAMAAAAAAAAAEGPGSGDAVLPLLRGRRVLLVESNAMVRHVLMLALRRWRCLVCTAASEAEAVQRLVANGEGCLTCARVWSADIVWSVLRFCVCWLRAGRCTWQTWCCCWATGAGRCWRASGSLLGCCPPVCLAASHLCTCCVSSACT